MRVFWRRFAFSFAGLSLLAACATVSPIVPVAGHEEGRSLYIGKCSSCHALHTPSSRTPDQWRKEVETMRGRAKLTDEEASAITAYLAAASAASQGAIP